MEIKIRTIDVSNIMLKVYVYVHTGIVCFGSCRYQASTPPGFIGLSVPKLSLMVIYMKIALRPI